MPKSSNVQALRLLEAVQAVKGRKEAENIDLQFPLSKSAEINKKFQWAKAVSEHLKKTCNEEEILKVREQCYCNEGSSTAKRMLTYLKKGSSIKDFVKIHNEKEKYGTLEYISENSFLMCYPQCYCSSVKHVKGDLSRTWCYCTLGYAKNLFSQVFDKKLEVELLESIKTGGNRCAVKVTLVDV